MLSHFTLGHVSLRLYSRAGPSLVSSNAWSRLTHFRKFSSARSAPKRTETVLSSKSKSRTGSSVLNNAQRTEYLSSLTGNDGEAMTPPPNGGLRVDDELESLTREQETAHEQVTLKSVTAFLQERLLEFEAAARELAMAVGRGDGVPLSEGGDNTLTDPDDAAVHPKFAPKNRKFLELLDRLQIVLKTFRSSWERAHRSDDVARDALFPAAFRRLSASEWNILSGACLFVKDRHAAKTVIELMEHGKLIPSDAQYESVLNWFAARGLVEEAEACVDDIPLESLSETQRLLLVLCRVNAKRLDEAHHFLQILQSRGVPAPMRAYKSVICGALRMLPPSPKNKMLQWKLFREMINVAHRVPDDRLYSTMLVNAPSIDHSLRLYEELIAENQIVNAHAYNVLIRRCASADGYMPQAFRIARQVINGHIPMAIILDFSTFGSLMYAARRTDDLLNARWAFSEISRLGLDFPDSLYVNTPVLTFLLTTYCTYRPPAEGSTSGEEESQNVPAYIPIEEVKSLPQTSEEVIREVTVLWKRVLKDSRPDEFGHDAASLGEPSLYKHVVLTPRLLNSFVKVHYVHSEPSASFKAFLDVFESSTIRPDAFTYIHGLEAYAYESKKLSEKERSFALSTARQFWKGWLSLDNSVFDRWHAHMDERDRSRLITRAWSAMIRHLTLAGQYEEAEELLRQFVTRYPPDDSLSPEYRTTPFMVFHDVAVLHAHAAMTQRFNLVDYIHWAMRAYEGRKLNKSHAPSSRKYAHDDVYYP